MPVEQSAIVDAHVNHVNVYHKVVDDFASKSILGTLNFFKGFIAVLISVKAAQDINT